MNKELALRNQAREEARNLVRNGGALSDSIKRLMVAFPECQEEQAMEALREQWVSTFENLGGAPWDEVLDAMASARRN
jgi:hypothetical protein